MNTIVYILSTIFIVATIVFVVLGYKLVKKMDSGFEPLEYDEVFGILENSIQQEFNLKYRLEYDLKDLRIIDFEKELRDITKSVLLSFSEDFYKHLDYYHNRDYVYSYVTKQIEILLLEFQNKIKPKTM